MSATTVPSVRKTVPALLSTIIYGIAILRKIELPSALLTLLVGANQCILLSLAMVVIAGRVGAGGLGAEVTRGLTRMELGVSMRAGLSIVALAIIMDRVCRGAMPKAYPAEP